MRRSNPGFKRKIWIASSQKALLAMTAPRNDDFVQKTIVAQHHSPER